MALIVITCFLITSDNTTLSSSSCHAAPNLQHLRSIITFATLIIFPISLTSVDTSPTAAQKAGNSGLAPPSWSCTAFIKSAKRTHALFNKKCKSARSDTHSGLSCRRRRIASTWRGSWWRWGRRPSWWRVWWMSRETLGSLVPAHILGGSGCRGGLVILWEVNLKFTIHMVCGGMRGRGGISRFWFDCGARSLLGRIWFVGDLATPNYSCHYLHTNDFRSKKIIECYFEATVIFFALKSYTTVASLRIPRFS